MSQNQNGQSGKTLLERLAGAADQARRHQGKSSLACPVKNDIPFGATALGTLSIRHQYLFQAMQDAAKDADEAMKRALAAREHFKQVHAAVFESISKEHKGTDFPNVGIAANWQVYGSDEDSSFEAHSLSEIFGGGLTDLLDRLSGRRERSFA